MRLQKLEQVVRARQTGFRVLLVTALLAIFTSSAVAVAKTASNNRPVAHAAVVQHIEKTVNCCRHTVRRNGHKVTVRKCVTTKKTASKVTKKTVKQTTQKVSNPVASTASATRTIPIGTAVNYRGLTESSYTNTALYKSTLDKNFTSLTPEWEMEWSSVEPQQGAFTFANADTVVNYGIAHNMSVRGHTLVWYSMLPSWLTGGSWTKASLEAVLKERIQTEVTHFKGRVNIWDVVNEPFNDDGTYRQDVFYNVIGPSYVALALQWAHQADPSAQLFINDYNVDWPGAKEQAMLTLIKQLKAAGVPLTGIGMEEHLQQYWHPSASQLAQAMSDYAALGMKIEVTEADVDMAGFTGTAAQSSALQAQVFGELASACRAQPACQRFTVWGVSDAVSWLGAGNAGLPFDSNYQPTASWSAIVNGLANP